MGVYLPGPQEPRSQLEPDGEGGALCPWCGETIDRATPCVSPPAVQTLLFHVDCAAELGHSLIADAREALLASGDGEWGARAVALVRYRLRRQEHD